MNAAGAILRIFSFVLVALLLPAAGIAATPDRDPAPHLDLTDTPESPIDLRSASFGQRGTDLVLRMTTESEWDPAVLFPDSGRALCVRIYYGTLRSPRRQLTLNLMAASCSGAMPIFRRNGSQRGSSPCRFQIRVSPVAFTH